jgi:pimeloyl-ACP methyl ester carboxylesterase
MSRPTAVLVHGGFHGGWCWSRVRAGLEAKGWEVFAPTLTGVSDRLHLAGPAVGIDTHVADVVNLIEAEEMEAVVLCGHSAGGVVVSGVAEAVPDRVAHLVYLDATVPLDGESVNDVLGEVEGVPQLFRELAAAGDRVLVPPGPFTAAAFGVEDAADAAWVERRLTAHPLRCFDEPVAVGPGFASVPAKTFVRAEGFPAEYGRRMVERYAADPDWDLRRWDVAHDMMITDPELVTRLLEESAPA